jgi:hypothetical protein
MLEQRSRYHPLSCLDSEMRQIAFNSQRGNKEHAGSLIQIKAASDTFSSVDAGSGADAANNPTTRSKRDSACPPQATTEAEGRAAGAWKSSRFYF